MRNLLWILSLGLSLPPLSVHALENCDDSFSPTGAEEESRFKPDDYLTWIDYAEKGGTGPYHGRFGKNHVAAQLSDDIVNPALMLELLPHLEERHLDFLSMFFKDELFSQPGRHSLYRLLRKTTRAKNTDLLFKTLKLYDDDAEIFAHREKFLYEKSQILKLPEVLLEVVKAKDLRLRILGIRMLGSFISDWVPARQKFQTLVKKYSPVLKDFGRTEGVDIYEEAREVLGEIVLATMNRTMDDGSTLIEVEANQMKFAKTFSFEPDAPGYLATQVVYQDVVKVHEGKWSFKDMGTQFTDVDQTEWLFFDRPQDIIRDRLFGPRNKPRPLGSDFVDFQSFLRYRILQAKPNQDFLEILYRQHRQNLEKEGETNHIDWNEMYEKFLRADYRTLWQGAREAPIPAAEFLPEDLGVLRVPFEKLWAFKALALTGALTHDLLKIPETWLPKRSQFTRDERADLLQHYFHGTDHGSYLRIMRTETILFPLGANDGNSGFVGNLSLEVLGKVDGDFINLDTVRVPRDTVEIKMKLLVEILTYIHGAEKARRILGEWGTELNDPFLFDIYRDQILKSAPFNENGEP
jgi:hypothetical protein